ncbi:serine hydrolase domain-containing protein [Lapidilactobacillus wuchangensis]|uniref:serine hydrolase domain-containing protein n=1 Tax=Lapidilactobacillus wuchangensis TaxID=2486001 RepID=UPI000F7AAFC5|nr:serine hydrolase domain-containing protein [Lapidilactobacillus wuchangensis]
MKWREKQTRKTLIGIVIFLTLFLLAVSWTTGRQYAIKKANESQLTVSQARQSSQAAANSSSAPKIDTKANRHQLSPDIMGTINPELQTKLATSLRNINFIGTGVIAKHGQIVAVWSNGYADANTGRKNGLDTTYNINSMQKSITGTLVMQQVVAGKIKLSDPLSKYYPEAAYSRSITIRQMLNMTSGLTMTSMGEGPYVSDEVTIANDIERLQFNNNSYNKWNYQAVNYVLLVGILEKVTKKSYHDLVMKNIVKRLKLEQTAFSYELTDYDLGATSYNGKVGMPYQKSLILNPDTQHYELGTGQMFMSVGDFYLTVRSMLDGTLISKADANVLFSGNYGGGFYNHPQSKISNGAGVYFGSTIHVSKDGQSAILLMSNYAGDYNQLKLTANQLEKAVFLPETNQELNKYHD